MIDGVDHDIEKFSPQAWGWTAAFGISGHKAAVFPTGVGVDRFLMLLNAAYRSFPHRRGGGPGYVVAAPGYPVVFPTGVGVDRAASPSNSRSRRFPHRRGGGPLRVSSGGRLLQFSPQAWGWTVAVPIGALTGGVFPTGVGVDRFFSDVFGDMPFVFPTGVGVDRESNAYESGR